MRKGSVGVVFCCFLALQVVACVSADAANPHISHVYSLSVKVQTSVRTPVQVGAASLLQGGRILASRSLDRSGEVEFKAKVGSYTLRVTTRTDVATGSFQLRGNESEQLTLPATGSIDALAVDDNQDPLAGVAVKALSASKVPLSSTFGGPFTVTTPPSILPSCQTGSSGACTLSGIAGVVYEVSATESLNMVQQASIKATSVGETWRITFNNPVTLVGTVYGVSGGTTGPGVEGATVELLQGGVIQAETTTNDNGSYSITTAPGTYGIFADDEGSVDWVGNVDVATSGLYDLYLDKSVGTLTVNVFDGSNPVADATVAVATADPIDPSYTLNQFNWSSQLVAGSTSCVTDSTGSCSLIGPDEIPLTLWVTGPQGQSATTTGTPTVAGGFALAELPGAQVAVSGTIDDSSGTPVSGATLELSDAGLPDIGSVVTSTDTNAAGDYSLSAVPGSYLVTVLTPSFAVSGSLDLTVPETWNLTLPAMGSIDVSVLDSASNPIPGASVLSGVDSTTISGIGGTNFEVTVSSPQSCTTDSSGSCDFQGIAGKGLAYNVSIPEGGFLGGTATPEVGGTPSSVSLPGPYQLTTLSGEVDDTNGNPMSGVVVTLEGLSAGNESTTTGASGGYAFGVVPGTYEVKFDSAAQTATGQVEVKGPTAEDATLSPLSQVTLSAEDVNGAPIGGADISALLGQPPIPSLTNGLVSSGTVTGLTCETDADGSCVVVGLEGTGIEIDAEIPFGPNLTAETVPTADTDTLIAQLEVPNVDDGISGELATNSDEPVGSADITLMRSDGSTMESATSSGDGLFELSAAPGQYTVDITSWAGDLQGVVTIAASTSWTIVLPPTGSVDVSVSDTSSGIPGTDVSAISPSAVSLPTALGSLQALPASPSCQTDGDGECEVPMFAGESATVEATTTYGKTASAVATATDTGTALALYVTDPLPSLQGTVDAADGAPVVGASVLAFDGPVLAASGSTDGNGQFHFFGLPSTTLAIWIDFDGEIITGNVLTTGPTALTDVTYTLPQAGSLQIDATSASGPVEGAQVVAFSATTSVSSNSSPSPIDLPLGTNLNCTTGATGSCVLDTFAGTVLYLWVVFPDGSGMPVKAVATAAGATVTVSFGAH